MRALPWARKPQAGGGSEVPAGRLKCPGRRQRRGPAPAGLRALPAGSEAERGGSAREPRWSWSPGGGDPDSRAFFVSWLERGGKESPLEGPGLRPGAPSRIPHPRNPGESALTWAAPPGWPAAGAAQEERGAAAAAPGAWRGRAGPGRALSAVLKRFSPQSQGARGFPGSAPPRAPGAEPPPGAGGRERGGRASPLQLLGLRSGPASAPAARRHADTSSQKRDAGRGVSPLYLWQVLWQG